MPTVFESIHPFASFLIVFPLCQVELFLDEGAQLPEGSSRACDGGTQERPDREDLQTEARGHQRARVSTSLSVLFWSCQQDADSCCNAVLGLHHIESRCKRGAL